MSQGRAVQAGAWRVWLAAGGEAARWVALVEAAVATGDPIHASKHAATYRATTAGGTVFIKAYHHYRRRTAVKDLLRPSKARNVLRVAPRLAARGFAVPRVLAVGEERRGRLRRRAWVVTAALAGAPLATAVVAPGRRALARKRAVLAAVGGEVGRLHQAGVVAGDLVPANVWVVGGADDPRVAFLDHDRTRLGSAPAPWRRARRNLVQLNRVVLPGVTATDRLRAYRAYAATRGWPWPTARRRLAWVIAKTIERRRRFDHVATAGIGFRTLMRADVTPAVGRACAAPGGTPRGPGRTRA